MNILLDKLPSSIEIDGTEYPIQTDFRLMIKFEQIIFEKKELSLAEIFSEFYMGNIPEDTEKALDGLLWFFRCGKDVDELPKSSKKSKKRIYSYDFDDGYIYAAFFDQYGIDLNSIQLHWWKFRDLLMSLKEDNVFEKIMGYRSIEISGKMSKEYKDFYREMKRTYALPASKAERDFQKEVERRLMSGEGV